METKSFLPMACTFDNTTQKYKFDQSCGQWNRPCCHGCGYMHLSTASKGTFTRCCADGKLSPYSTTDMDLLVQYELDELPDYWIHCITSNESFVKDATTMNNLLAMAATKVCNYTGIPGWTNRGPGDTAVTLNGRVYHFLPRTTNNGTDPSCGLSYFLFDNSSALAASGTEREIDTEMLLHLGEELKKNNPYCRELHYLGMEATSRQLGPNRNTNIVPIMPNQSHHLDICSVINCRQNNSLVLQVEPTDGTNVSDIQMDSKEVEPLCFPLLLPCGHSGWVYDMHKRLSAMEYLAARLLKPEMKDGKYLTAAALCPTFTKVDRRTGEPFDVDENPDVIEEHKVPGEVCELLLRINRFQWVPRLGEYFCMDLYSRMIDARLDIIRHMNRRIMMGQARARSAAARAREEAERNAAGFSNPDRVKQESYLPDTVHGSPRHMAAMAKNALILVSEFGCPHAFATLTCNPFWPEIQSQLLVNQTAYDRPDIVCPVFKARLDRMKHNLRNGKYFDGCKVIYMVHVIEYQYRGLPHAHIVIRFDRGVDIDDNNEFALLDFVNRHFIAEYPRFAGEEDENVSQDSREHQYDEDYKQKARELVRIHNIHKCNTAVNACKKEPTDQCRRGYDRTSIIPCTYVDENRNRVIYLRRNEQTDLRVVPYNLSMLMDWASHINIEYSGSAFSALYIYKYCYKNPSRKERIEMSSEQDCDSQDEVKLFMYGRVMCAMDAMWRLYGYQDYPASEPAVVSFKVRTGAQLEDFYQRGQITDLMIYYHRPVQLALLTYTSFWEQYNVDKSLPKYYANKPALKNESYFELSIPFPSKTVTRFIYRPIKTIRRCVRMEMQYPMNGEIYYARVILLKRPVLNDEDARTYHPPRGGGPSVTYLTYQQSAIAHGYIANIKDALLTFDDMCSVGTPSLCRSYFVVLTMQGYATHAIFDTETKRNYMLQDFIIFDHLNHNDAEQKMLQDLERKFRKENSSLQHFGFPMPAKVPTELELEQKHWKNPQVQQEQREILRKMNELEPNNTEQQYAYNEIMDSVRRFSNLERDTMHSHEFYFISGPGGTGKSSLFKKLQATCRAEGILIAVCAATTLAALLYDGGLTAHSLFSYPVIDDEDIDDINPAKCNFSNERGDFLREVLVIFWDEIVSNDRSLFEAVLTGMATTWDAPRYFIFVCAGDFAQVSNNIVHCDCYCCCSCCC